MLVHVSARCCALIEFVTSVNVSNMPCTCTGASGVGKSSTANSIFAERVANVTALQSDTAKAQCFSRVAAGFTLSIIDTPGVLEGDAINGAVCFHCQGLCA